MKIRKSDGQNGVSAPSRSIIGPRPLSPITRNFESGDRALIVRFDRLAPRGNDFSSDRVVFDDSLVSIRCVVRIFNDILIKGVYLLVNYFSRWTWSDLCCSIVHCRLVRLIDIDDVYRHETGRCVETERGIRVETNRREYSSTLITSHIGGFS